MTNKTGPWTVPCGMPLITGAVSDLRWCIGIRSNLNIWPQTECLSHENE